MKWFLWLFGAAYALCPYDLLPDFLVGPGWIDDLVLLGAIWWYFSALRRKLGWQTRGRETAGSYGSTGEGRAHKDSGSHSPADHAKRRSPYDVLGVHPGAGAEEIRSAYRKLAAQYHPDKVSHLGQEFQSLAEQRFKEIQEAYATIKASGLGQQPRR